MSLISTEIIAIGACFVSALLQNNKDLRIFESFSPKKETKYWEEEGSEICPKDELLKNFSLPYFHKLLPLHISVSSSSRMKYVL